MQDPNWRDVDPDDVDESNPLSPLNVKLYRQPWYIFKLRCRNQRYAQRSINQTAREFVTCGALPELPTRRRYYAIFRPLRKSYHGKLLRDNLYAPLDKNE